MRGRAATALALTLAIAATATSAALVVVDRTAAPIPAAVAAAAGVRPAPAPAPAPAAPGSTVVVSGARVPASGPTPPPGPVPTRSGPQQAAKDRVPGHRSRSAPVVPLRRPGSVALTFDDGPDPPWTGRVLDLLSRRHVPATFCMIGRQIPAYPGLVRRIARAGDGLCDHTWDHDLDLRVRPRRQIALDIGRAAHAIARATHGLRPAFFRAPGGNWSQRIDALAHADGMAPLRWTVDPRDWTRPGVHRIVRSVLSELRPGGVILLHDGGGNRAQTLAALRILLRKLPRLGYHFVLPPAP